MRIISLKGTSLEITNAIQSYVEEKVEALSKICSSFDPADELRIEIGKVTQHHAKGPFFRAEMLLHLPGKELMASQESEDLYEAIDKVKDQMRRQLSEYKEKLKDRSKKVIRPGKE
ncbi:ribosome-associated translation inhibitor RaiA [Candidatus Uhrbacteria bacterium]|nr:ribosome-associated translation inhibitor RaiA [Candidatus Uhrbacteria bacterium]